MKEIKDKQTAFRISMNEWQKLKEYADQRNESISEVMRRLVKDFLEERDNAN